MANADNNINIPTPGYPKLAHHMGLFPELAIFRRFKELNCKNLLYYQAELIELEHELRKCEKADARETSGNRPNYAKDWYWLQKSEQDGNDDQWQTILRIRAVLKEYSKLRRRST